MKLKELKAELIRLMQTKFPPDRYKYYSMAVTEGMERPAFFTQIRPTDFSPVNYNSRNCNVIFAITYFQAEPDEVDMLDTVQGLRDMFGLGVRAGGRHLGVSDFGWSYIGTEMKVPEILVSLEWMESIDHSQTLPLMEEAVWNYEMEGR